MSFFMHHLEAILDIPPSTLTLIVVMCGTAMYFIREALVIPALVIVLGPFVVLLAVLANYGLTLLEYFPLNRYDQWLICTITSATIGIVVGLCIAAMLARVMDKSEAKRSRFHQA